MSMEFKNMTISVIVAVSANERTLDSYFRDWYEEVFGYGYGSGEPHILSVIREFMRCICDDGKYDYEHMEQTLGGPVAWLLIDTFCRKNIIEYGTSPRVGWFEPEGMAVREYVNSKSLDDLVRIVTGYDPDGDGDGDGMNQYCCCTTHCNCSEEEDEGRKNGCTKNPFFSLFYKGKYI